MKPSPPRHVFLLPIYIYANSKLNNLMRPFKKSLTSIYTSSPKTQKLSACYKLPIL